MKTTSKVSRYFGLETSSDFKARAKDTLFGGISTADVLRNRYSSICFADIGIDEVATYGQPKVQPQEPTPEPESQEPTSQEQTPEPQQEPVSTPQEPAPQEPENKMSTAEARLLKETMKWKEKAKNAQAELEAAKTKAGQADSLSQIIGDISEDDLKALVENKKQQEIREKEARGEYESIISQVKEQQVGELASRDAIIAEKDQTIAKLKEKLAAASNEMEELTVGRHFSDSNFLKQRATLPPSIARQIFGSYFDIEEGGVVAYDKPRGIEGRAPLVNSQAENLGFEAAIERLITSHPESKTLLRSTMKPGSGSNTANAEAQVTEKLSGVEKIRKGLVG